MTKERITPREFRGLAYGKGKKANKFHARRTTVDGITFHSAKEARRFSNLKLLERAGQIRDLKLQVPYPLIVSGHLVTTYVADFEYDELVQVDLVDETGDRDQWRRVTEDVKGVRTPDYRIKAELFFALTGRRLLET